MTFQKNKNFQFLLTHYPDQNPKYFSAYIQRPELSLRLHRHLRYIWNRSEQFCYLRLWLRADAGILLAGIRLKAQAGRSAKHSLLKTEAWRLKNQKFWKSTKINFRSSKYIPEYQKNVSQHSKILRDIKNINFDDFWKKSKIFNYFHSWCRQRCQFFLGKYPTPRALLKTA